MLFLNLDNGLRCCICRREGSAMAVVDVLYNVGARDESPHLTGMAHLFEHLMFGGSVNIPAFDAELEAAGGNSNAWTSNDFTNFYDILPAANIETALHLESDRMLGLAFTPHSLEVQRSVVIEEFKQNYLNRPYGDIFHRLRALLYSENHPYSWPTIGLTPDHIAAVTLDDVRHWFFSHYAPNNAILSIIAPQPEEEIAQMVRQWFADLPMRQIKSRSIPEPGFPSADVSETVIDPKVPQPQIIIAYPMAPYGEPEYFAADTITDILSAGRSGRCWRNLIHGPVEGLFAAADASIIGSEHHGMLLLSAALADSVSDADINRAAAMLDAEFRALSIPGNLTQYELDRTLNNFEATYAFEGLSAQEMALRQALALYHGEEPDHMIADRRALTTDTIATTAAAIASRPKATLIYR